MNQYLQRYQSGEQPTVWEELRQLGETVRDEPMVDDALAVVRAAIERIRHNLELLHERLLELGYSFAHPEDAFRLATAETRRTVDRVEDRMGPLPLTIRAWYDVFDSVDFTQAPAQLFGQQGPEPVQGLGLNPQLHIKPLRKAVDEQATAQPADEPIRLSVGPTLSNCDIAGVYCPNPSVDELQFALDERPDGSFIGFLRDCLTAGGFPFWKATGGRVPDAICPARPDYDELLPRLTEDFRKF